ncbi:MAG: PIG-L family deacetylase, partial [Acidobacteriaceae bacterium]|nr:PIG-L family deacetylase [Acidobacteriaceae bacterium]
MVFWNGQRVLLIVAHPDDESIGAGILLQRSTDVQVVFCSSGAPNRFSIWRRFGTPWHYARIRECEARTALKMIHHETFTFLRFQDGKLYRFLPEIYRRVANVLNSWKPDLILTHAFEGGHEDHDVCSFLGHCLARHSGLPVWEMPLYHLDPATGALVYQTFPNELAQAKFLTPTSRELEMKQKMFDAYRSQHAVLNRFDVSREVFRPQIQYDYFRPAIPVMPRIAVSGLPAERLVIAFQSFLLEGAGGHKI